MQSKKTLIVMFAFVVLKDLSGDEDGRNCWMREGLKVVVERDFRKQFMLKKWGGEGQALLPFVSE